ncbi:ester cyclase [Larkinella soli]|uniref:ester cyclase n=1 Tax=Larkinella soli TaxID=1770527 RepID=UPI000FFC8C7C|nr:nuclear transport factor 2 family protein [Larkinella soli]
MKTTQQESLTDLTRKGTSIEFFSAYQEKEIDRMMALFDPNGDFWLMPLGPEPQGTIGELGKNFWVGVMDAFPDIDNTVDKMTTEGDRVICNVVLFGTQKKDFAGITSKGLKFNSDHIFIFRFNEEDRITSVAIDWDHEHFQKQLGV